MAYPNGECQTGRINYFSNPDVKYNGHVTGDSMNNCAQQIRDTMVEFPAAILRVS